MAIKLCLHSDVLSYISMSWKMTKLILDALISTSYIHNKRNGLLIVCNFISCKITPSLHPLKNMACTNIVQANVLLVYKVSPPHPLLPFMIGLQDQI